VEKSRSRSSALSLARAPVRVTRTRGPSSPHWLTRRRERKRDPPRTIKSRPASPARPLCLSASLPLCLSASLAASLPPAPCPYRARARPPSRYLSRRLSPGRERQRRGEEERPSLPASSEPFSQERRARDSFPRLAVPVTGTEFFPAMDAPTRPDTTLPDPTRPDPTQPDDFQFQPRRADLHRCRGCGGEGTGPNLRRLACWTSFRRFLARQILDPCDRAELGPRAPKARPSP
jgi:hypothetical protein